MGFNKRKWWPIGKQKSISIEIAGWKDSPHIIFEIEPEERKMMFSISLGIAIYISISGIVPISWFPTMSYTTGGNRYPEEREISLKIHGGQFWWNFWVSDDWSSWTKNKSWRKGNFDFMGMMKGRHKYERKEADRRQFLLPFLEGVYNVEVIKFDRTDSYTHWPTRRMVSWEVRAGYYDGPPNEPNWKDKGIPVEGKGENSYDCDEDATFSISFPGYPYRKDLRTPYEAVLYFWHSVMKSREQRGSAKWVPQGFKETKLNIIR